MGKTKTINLVWVLFACLLIPSVIITILTFSSSTMGTAYQAGDSIYSSWVECANDNAVGTSCVEIAASSTSNLAEKLPGLLTAFLLLTAAFTLAFSSKLKSKIGAYQEKAATQRRESEALREAQKAVELERERAQQLVQAAQNTETKSSQNLSLYKMSSNTSVLITLGAIAGVIAMIVYFANTSNHYLDLADKVANLAIAGAWGHISKWLIGIGILGKLLIGAANIVVEGLGGNIGKSSK